MAIATAIASAGCGQDGDPASSSRPTKIYVVSQHRAAIDVLDGTTLLLSSRIPTGDRRTPHMIEVSPARDQLWISNPHQDSALPDEVLVVDPRTDKLLARVELDIAAYPQHLAIAPDGRTVYVGGLGNDKIYRIDARSFTLGPAIQPRREHNPHGLRLSPDGSRLYTANVNSTVTEYDTATGATLRDFTLPGPGLQLVLGDGALFVTVPMPATVCRIELASGVVTAWPLPADARAPGALAWVSTAAGPRLAVAEQGDVINPGEHLLLLDPATGALMQRHDIGRGGHGIAVTPGGAFVLVTGMYNDTVSVVDLASDLTTQANVDAMPAGIAAWSAP